MKINAVIVTDQPSRGEKAGRYMADVMREQMSGFDWELIIHVRGPEDARKGIDTSFATYNGGPAR